jgi:hypothetical protein
LEETLKQIFKEAEVQRKQCAYIQYMQWSLLQIHGIPGYPIVLRGASLEAVLVDSIQTCYEAGALAGILKRLRSEPMRDAAKQHNSD